MNWFKKKKKNETDHNSYACASGQWVKQENLPDPMFAQGMMGPAWGIDCEDGNVYAPFTGTVTMVFPTGHALGLKREDGLEQLIHIGVDTVKLNGKGFEMQVKENQKVEKGDLLVHFDPQLIRQASLDPTIICTFTTPLASLTPLNHGQMIQAQDPLFEAICQQE